MGASVHLQRVRISNCTLRGLTAEDAGTTIEGDDLRVDGTRMDHGLYVALIMKSLSEEGAYTRPARTARARVAASNFMRARSTGSLHFACTSGHS